MSKKSRSRSKTDADPTPATIPELIRRRRNRRLIFVGLVGLSFPILEAIAYRFRAIAITVDNRSDRAITGVEVSYPGGSFEAPEIKPGGAITRLTRPDFSFRGSDFCTYRLTIRFTTADGAFHSQTGRTGALDFSAHETYVFESALPEGPAQLKHATSPGFPLSAIRDILTRLGVG